MASLYADEDVPIALINNLRQLGHDVVAVDELGRGGGRDAQVLADATAESRTVLTFDRWHFEKLHQQSKAHAGIISCSRDGDSASLAHRIDQALGAAGPLAGQHIRVNRPPMP